MKTKFFAASLFATGLLLTGCIKDSCKQTVTYIADVPVYKTVDEVRQPISTDAPRALENPGKIYVSGQYVLINEIDEGIHVINNSNPSAPQNVAFINIPGNVDMAMKGNVMYADNYMDLLAIDMTNPTQATMLKRIENLFPTFGTNPENSEELLVKYVQKEVTETMNCDEAQQWNNPWVMDDMGVANTGATGGGAGRAVSGLGGSMARFAIAGDYLYTVDHQDLHVISILTMNNPQEVNLINVTWGVETVFPYGDNLFIGSNNGMHIYDNSNPEQPTYVSEFQHAFACDPVYVDGNFAYITLRNGSPCREANNQLDVVDISNINAPTLVRSYNMDNPHGLSVNDDILYLCEGDFGFKTFDVSNKNTIDQNLLSQIDTKAYDVIAIPHTDLILVVGEDGFYQYDATNINNLSLVSKIEVEQ